MIIIIMGWRIGTTGQLAKFEEHLSKTCTIQFCKFMLGDQSDYIYIASDHEVDKSLFINTFI